MRITTENAVHDIGYKLGRHVKLIDEGPLEGDVRVLVTDDTTSINDKDGPAEVTTRRLSTYVEDQQITQTVLTTTIIREAVHARRS